MTSFLSERFPHLDWQFDRRISGGCSKRRPDAFVNLRAHVLSVEVDEFEHSHAPYTCICENRKVMDHFVDAGSISHVFVRFNPDAYWLNGERYRSCWSKRASGEPHVSPKRHRDWESRLDKLAQIVAHFATTIPEREVELIHLFYSDSSAPDDEGDL